MYCQAGNLIPDSCIRGTLSALFHEMLVLFVLLGDILPSHSGEHEPAESQFLLPLLGISLKHFDICCLNKGFTKQTLLKTALKSLSHHCSILGYFFPPSLQITKSSLFIRKPEPTWTPSKPGLAINPR